VLVPVAITGGWFGGSKTAFAARELFTLAKAARVYASTYNVETALAYGVELVEDTQLPDGRVVAVATEMALARRLKRDEIIRINAARAFPEYALPPLALDGAFFVPLTMGDGAFRPLPKQMCILPDLFEVDDPLAASPVSQHGLMGVQIYDVASHSFFEARTYDFNATPSDLSDDERLDYIVNGDAPNFPAHRFLPDGSMRVDGRFTRQRFTIRVGARPDAVFKDRFTIAGDGQPSETALFTRFYSSVAADPVLNTVPAVAYFDDENYPAEIDTPVEFFVPTGRVKLVP